MLGIGEKAPIFTASRGRGGSRSWAPVGVGTGSTYFFPRAMTQANDGGG